MKNYQNIIRINPEKRFGKPCIRMIFQKLQKMTFLPVFHMLLSGKEKSELLHEASFRPEYFFQSSNWWSAINKKREEKPGLK